jgi:hypothetical protein
MREFWRDSTFWTALVGIGFVIAAAASPGLKPTFDALTPLVTTLIVAILGRSAVIQIAAFTQGYKKDATTGEWTKS